MHEYDHGDKGRRFRARFAWHDRVRAKRNVERRAASNRRPTIRSTYPAAEGFPAPPGAGTDGAELSGSQKSSAGDQPADEILLGKANGWQLVAASRPGSEFLRVGRETCCKCGRRDFSSYLCDRHSWR